MFFLMIRRPPRSTLFPTRRSSDLGVEAVTGTDVEHDVDRGGRDTSYLTIRGHDGPVSPGGYDNDRGPQSDDALRGGIRSEEHTSELQSRQKIVCRLLLEKKNKQLRTLMASSIDVAHLPVNSTLEDTA